MMNKMREDWIEVELGEICFTTSGGTPSRNQMNFYQGSIPWVKSGELDKGIIYDTEEHISEEAIQKSSAKIFPKGTLLIALYGATIGKLAFLGVDAATNQAICGIYRSQEVDSKYLYNFLLYRKQKLISQGTGGAQPNISQTILKKLEVPLAPLPIQRAIVSKIEALFSDLDNGMANFKKAQEQLKIYRQSVLKKAFEGELTREWREKQTNLPTAEELLQQIKQERQNHYNQQIEEWKKAVKEWEKEGTENSKPTKPQSVKEVHTLRDDDLENLCDLPEGWGWVKLGNVCLKIMDGTHFSPKNTDKGDYKYITAKNIKEGRIDLSNITYVSKDDHKSIYSRCDVKKGDVLYIKDGATTGRAAVNNMNEEFSLLSSVGVFRVSENVILPKYLEYFLNAEVNRNRMLENVAGVAITRLTLVKLNNSSFSVCSLQEQTQIVQEIERRLSVCDKMEQSIKESLAKAEALRQSILKKAFEGKLLTEAEIQQCKQEADYEPASELLKKIQAEKVAKGQATNKKKRKE